MTFFWTWRPLAYCTTLQATWLCYRPDVFPKLHVEVYCFSETVIYGANGLRRGVFPMTGPFAGHIGIWLQIIWIRNENVLSGLSSIGRVTHCHFSVRMAWLVASVSTVSAASTMAYLVELAMMLAFFTTAIRTRISQCLLHEFGPCGHSGIFGGLVCHGCGSQCSQHSTVGSCAIFFAYLIKAIIIKHSLLQSIPFHLVLAALLA